LYSEGSPFSKIRERHEEKHRALWAEKDSMSIEEFTLAYEKSIQGFDDEMFDEFKSRLFPDQLEKLDRLLIRAEVLKLGLLASICYGRLGKEIGVTQAEIKKCLEVGEQQTQALQKAIRELTLQVDDNFGKLLDDDQRSFLKERVGVFDTKTLLGSCPSLLVLPRK
jgi:hypothetical protein